MNRARPSILDFGGFWILDWIPESKIQNPKSSKIGYEFASQPRSFRRRRRRA
jgi:hypothetical protein